MHKRDALAFELDGVTDGAVDEPHATAVTHRLDPDADFHVTRKILCADCLPKFFGGGLGAETDFLEVLWKFLCDEIQDFLRFGRAGGVFDSRVNVLGVFAEDDHVHLLRVLHRRGDALKVLDWPQADVEIEHLAQSDVERANAAADWRGEWTFDADQIFLERLDCVIRQPVIEFVLGRFARKHFEPRNLALAPIGLLHRRIEHTDAGGPDVRPGAVTANERENGIVRHLELAILN